MNAIPVDQEHERQKEQEVLGEGSEYTVLKSKSMFSPAEKNKTSTNCEPEPGKNHGNTGNDASLTDPRVTQLQTPLKKNDKLVS